MKGTQISVRRDVEAGYFATLRRDIHAHPELGFKEVRTSALIADTISSWGIPVYREVGRTGVVGVLRNGDSQRAIGFRADMDALPISEENLFAHASTHQGVMHACGHDGHTAMLLAAGKYLVRHRNYNGTIYLIFQPAEEGGGGARVMMDDGLFDRFPMDAIFGLHNWPGLETGRFAIAPGPVFASTSDFGVNIHGKGAHAAMPHNGIDPVIIGCQVVQAFQTIITRNIRPIDAAVISVTMINAGQATNVIPESCAIRGTVRTFSSDVLDTIEQRMCRIANLTCESFGATCEFKLNRNYPATVNHMKETAFVREVLAEVVGDDNVVEFESTMGAEDFSFFLTEKPGCYFVLGNGSAFGQDGSSCGLHNPRYDFNDELIPIGASMWIRMAEKWLA